MPIIDYCKLVCYCRVVHESVLCYVLTVYAYKQNEAVVFNRLENYFCLKYLSFSTNGFDASFCKVPVLYMKILMKLT